MEFRFSQAGEAWFSNVRDQVPFRSKFDLYYLCLMIGIAAGRKADPSGAEFIGYFIDDYKSSGRLIAGLLTVAELRGLGINMTEKADVRRVIAELLDPISATGLSDEGMRNLNRFAAGGFAYLSEHREKPHHADEFLADYQGLLGAAVIQADIWKDGGGK